MTLKLEVTDLIYKLLQIKIQFIYLNIQEMYWFIYFQF